MPQKLQTELIAQIASGIPEPELSLPNEPVVEAAMLGKTEQRAIRLLALAAKSSHDLEPHHQEEMAHLSYLVASRGRAWNRGGTVTQEDRGDGQRIGAGSEASE